MEEGSSGKNIEKTGGSEGAERVLSSRGLKDPIFVVFLAWRFQVLVLARLDLVACIARSDFLRSLSWI